MDALALPIRQKADIDGPEAIHELVTCFYGKVLRHPGLRVFFDAPTLTRHLPIIEAYWERMLLGGQGYRRNMVNIHREIHRQHNISSADFDHWLALFTETVDCNFAGPRAEKAKFLARAIVNNLRRLLLTPFPMSGR